jgi:hypothetical protein
MKNNKTFDTLSRWLIGVAIFLVLFAFFSPLIFTREGFIDFSDKGPIGDTIGGIMNPFIGLASIIVMFLAFYMQFKANKMMQSQFERNQFENQFFEMLKTHKENSNNIINTSFSYTPVGTKKFPNTGFKALVDKIGKEYENKNGENKDDTFNEVYVQCWEDSFGHYFRHLFLIVKFVVSKEDNLLTYEDVRAYLRILRASLSTYEQIFLYYNWLSGFAKQWENNDNKFFTDYRMIHNINPDLIIKDFDIRNISPFKEQLGNNARKEKNRNPDNLFEFEDW